MPNIQLTKQEETEKNYIFTSQTSSLIEVLFEKPKFELLLIFPNSLFEFRKLLEIGFIAHLNRMYCVELKNLPEYEKLIWGTNAIVPLMYSLSFLQHVQLAICRHIEESQQWPEEPCKALSSCFVLLEEFLQGSDNWETSRCSSEELQQIENNLNKLLHFLRFEKIYACEFWGLDKRRIEASFTHLYTFYQQLLKAIIPHENFNLFDCKTAHKLCVNMGKFEKMVNLALKQTNKIASFLSEPYFQEERSLVKNFFENWVQFLKNLPKIKHNKFNHVHKLVHYIVLSNPIEICLNFKNSLLETKIRKKSKTMINVENKDPSKSKKEMFKSTLEIRENAEKVLKKCKSTNFTNSFDFGEQSKKEQEFSKIFKFSNLIYYPFPELKNQTENLYSFNKERGKSDENSKNIRETTITLESHELKQSTKFTKDLTSENLRRQTKNSTEEKSSIISGSPTKRTRNKNVSNATLSSNKKKATSVKFYETESDKDDRQYKSSSNKSLVNFETLYSSKITKTERLIELERANKKTIDIINGKNKNNGWAVVRDYFWKKVALRRLTKSSS